MNVRSQTTPLVSIQGLFAGLGSAGSAIPILRGIDLSIAPGEIVGLVGESGSGKTMTALAALRLLPENVRVTAGSIIFAGSDLLKAEERELRHLRGGRIAMIFQDPIRHLNPVFTIGQQLGAVILAHAGRKLSRAEVRDRSVELLEQVSILNAAERLKSYPYQFSGGMAQRLMIALALAGSPDLLLADEPTSALDVTVQAEILLLLRRIARERGMSILFISHNLAAVWQLCDRICVMYCGQIVEDAPRDALVEQPQHPYTRALLGALPHLTVETIRLMNIPGSLPWAADLPPGCSFHPRCAQATAVCSGIAPSLRGLTPVHRARCHHAPNPTYGEAGA